MYQTFAHISLSNILHNALALKEACQAPLIAVIKDDAYGHGAETVAHCLQPRVSAFAVASVAEGVALRTAGISSEILVLAPFTAREEGLQAAYYQLTVAVCSFAQLQFLQRLPVQNMKAHLAVNTGMNRYGFLPQEVQNACKNAKKLQITGVFSHFYLAERERDSRAQFTLFEGACATVLHYFPTATRHISATGGALSYPDCRLDAIRCGLGLYGYLPEGITHTVFLKRAMKVYATVGQSGLFCGEGVGYQRQERRIKEGYTLKYGYGDGFFRRGGVGVGKLCMDACVCEGRADFGEKKLIFDNAEEYAKTHGTSVYEVLCAVGRGAVKVYEGEFESGI